MELTVTAANVVAVIASALLLVTLTNVLFWPRVRQVSAAWAGQVSVLIPARNEEQNLSACLAAVLRQGSLIGEVLVYNDHSTDGTDAIIVHFAQQDARVRAVLPQPLAVGWCGKNFACAQLARAAQGSWLLFLDADAQLLPDAVARMVAEAQARRLTMLSCWPGLVMESFWEKALMPLLNLVVFSIFPGVLSLVRGEASLGLAHGSCLLFERAAYEKLGGHSAVRDQIFEDTRLAQLWRRCGERSLGLDGQDIVQVRMYRSFAEIWLGFQKNFFPAFRREINFWLFWWLHATVFCAPFILVWWNWAWAWAAGAVLLARLLLAWRFRHSFGSVLLQPFTESLLLVLGLSSWWRCKSGRGVAWKGREYLKVRASS